MQSLRLQSNDSSSLPIFEVNPFEEEQACDKTQDANPSEQHG
jgi:hypothetical protein